MYFSFYSTSNVDPDQEYIYFYGVGNVSCCGVGNASFTMGSETLPSILLVLSDESSINRFLLPVT